MITSRNDSSGQPRGRPAIGLTIMVLAIAMFFWWGFHFEVFGQRIRPSLPHLGFIGWLVFGAFGMGFAAGGVRAGVKGAGSLIVLVAVAVAIGVALGNYG
ncbi:hypothetical protein [Caulobacter sp. 17J65-9]|uniref:hypothetical protein n=1 Tax=Caulobacter sp. 17J65-9 TaxID=2709382 RepID=UPI0013C61C46|nr:hypothetical protein [Caulobacter sp. 17J65-9]NEX94415.1 hypothetical protein [Caulobacter sp. 17J65-9]